MGHSRISRPSSGNKKDLSTDSKQNVDILKGINPDFQKFFMTSITNQQEPTLKPPPLSKQPVKRNTIQRKEPLFI